MEQVFQQQQSKQSERKSGQTNEIYTQQKSNFNLSQEINSVENINNQYEIIINQNQDRCISQPFGEWPISANKIISSSSSFHMTNKIVKQHHNQLPLLSCCRHTNNSKLRQCLPNTECFEENTTHHNSSQSSLNTSSVSCSSNQNIFESIYFSRPPAPSSSSSTQRKQKQLMMKPKILYEEQDEDIDEVHTNNEVENNSDNQLDIKDQQMIHDFTSKESSFDEEQEEERDNDDEDNDDNDMDSENEFDENQEKQQRGSDQEEGNIDEDLKQSFEDINSYMYSLTNEIRQNSHNAKLIAKGSQSHIYSLAVDIPSNSHCEFQPEIKNVVLKTYFHQNNVEQCNQECDKLGKEFYILQKFSGHPYIIQAYSLEHDLNLPKVNAKRINQNQYSDNPYNCSLVMEQATCDLITYFTQDVYKTHPHHYYKFLQNKHQYSILCSNDFSTQVKNSFYNCFPGIFYDILTGLDVIHSSKLAHNDIKPDNMLFFSSSSSAKLCDFERCNSQSFDLKRTDFVYQSPEIVQIYKEYKRTNEINTKLFHLDLLKNDIFSFGVTLFSTMFGFYPFADQFEKNNQDELYSLLISADRDQFWQEKEISSICQTIEHNTNFSYLYNFKKFIEDTLEENPSNRIDTSSLMNHDFFEEQRHYRTEKDLYDQAARQYHQNTNNSSKAPASQKNKINPSVQMDKSLYSANKINDQEEYQTIQTNCIQPIYYLTPQTKANSIISRSRQVSIDCEFTLKRSCSVGDKQREFFFSPSGPFSNEQIMLSKELEKETQLIKAQQAKFVKNNKTQITEKNQISKQSDDYFEDEIDESDYDDDELHI
ncbi:kinase domain protein (macronuclear) [Tetrahymena thermophila SB210]|uniref:Kinase domain protein n=1 Tax=Tetrahymena thermophila (strain SB210) TaxID=312017 RepID=I7MM71_TETTS|nr:kinase domain protein [Tetrahymena thermophila SB210]EAS04285.2 kinase domain protein [Tetrahymena thermophila SB210]|eukprot:XP_001024530.2 kinase domain protein [Tetrahymena thermophila SB210]